MIKRKQIACLFAFVLLLTGCGNKVEENALGLNDTYEGTNFDVQVTDFYLGDFVMNEDLNLSFDQYVVADVVMTNKTEENQKASTLLNFEVEDGYGRHAVVIDENDKKFAKELEPGESFEIPLVFAVDEADEYQLYYNESLKEEDEDSAVWNLSGTDLEKRKVEFQQTHNEGVSKEEVER